MENEIQDEIQNKSKTQIKKEADELQKLGVRLIELSVDQLKRIELPDALRTALVEARSIKSNIASRRHRQFIGVLMRGLDPVPILHALLQANANQPVEPINLKETRVWLDRLLTGEQATLEEFLIACPGLERQRLRQLLRNIKKEKTASKPSKSLKVLERLILKNMNDK